METVESCKDNYLTFEFEDDIPVTLNIGKIRKATPRILERYSFELSLFVIDHEIIFKKSRSPKKVVS